MRAGVLLFIFGATCSWLFGMLLDELRWSRLIDRLRRREYIERRLRG